MRPLLLVLSVLLAFLLPLPAGAEPRVLAIALISPPGNVMADIAEAFAADLSAAAPERFRPEVFHSGRKGNEAAELAQLEAGDLDIAFVTAGELSRYHRGFAALYAPFLVDGLPAADRLLRGPTAQGLLAELPRAAGLVGVGYAGMGLRNLVLRDGPPSGERLIEGLAGLRVRTSPIRPIEDFYDLLGLRPEPLPLPAARAAFFQKRVDAVDLDLAGICGQRYHEGAKTVLLSRHMMFPMVGVISLKTWEALPPADRELLWSTLRRHLDRAVLLHTGREETCLAVLREAGVAVEPVPPAAFGPVRERWAERQGDIIAVVEALLREAGHDR